MRKAKKEAGKNAVIYARVSSKEQEKEGFSIPAQKKLLNEYAKANSIAVVRTFTDVETAKSSGRAQFGKMLEFLGANGDTRLILVEKTDRLYRNFRDYVRLEDLDVEIHLVKENEIISKDSRSHAKFIHGIKLLMAKNYIDNLSEEVKKGLREKAEQGEWPQQAPLGYVNNGTTHLVEPDPRRAPLITRLFELYATGQYSLTKVRDRIDAEGLKSRTGKRLSRSMIERTLKNPFYYGEFVWKGDRYEGIHEPLISQELFEKVQNELRRNGKPKSRKGTFAFAGLLRCGRCGCQITAEIKKEKYVYYHCTGAKGKCTQPYVREEVLDEKLAEIVRAVQIEPHVAEWIKEALRSSLEEEKEFREKEMERLKRRYDNLQSRIDKAYEDRVDGVIDHSYWAEVSAKWRDEQNKVLRLMDGYQRAHRDYLERGVRILELAQHAYSLYVKQEPREKRRLLDCLLSNCTLDGLTLYPTYKKPFDLIVEGAKTTEKLGRQDSNLGMRAPKARVLPLDDAPKSPTKHRATLPVASL
jgi:site-specific DNA recombinase